MKTTYEIRTPDLSGIFISFEHEPNAMRWWRENVENAPSTSLWSGAVVVKRVRETYWEAESARLDFLIGDGGVAKFSRACLEGGGDGTDWPAEARRALDIARDAPPEVTVVIWPNGSREPRNERTQDGN